jgi:hypothetical protein
MRTGRLASLIATGKRQFLHISPVKIQEHPQNRSL